MEDLVLNKGSIFYEKAKQMLRDYKNAGGKLEDLKSDSPIYRYIKNTRLFDDEGKLIDLETKFKLLGYSRKSKISKNLREDLIGLIKDYIKSGGSLHIERKKLPFYEKLHSYQISLKRQGRMVSHEYIMKYDLGFREFSDLYYRCRDVEKLKLFRDRDGYVDSYRSHKVFNNYIKEVAQTFNIPIYFVTDLLADERMRKYEISIDKVAYTERLLHNYVNKHGTFVGIKRNDTRTYEAFNYLIKYYSDGTEEKFTKSEWLEMFGLDHVENKFRDSKNDRNVDINDIMIKLQRQYNGQTIILKNLDPSDYRAIIKKAVNLGVNVSQIFEMYELKCNGIKIDRLSKVWVEDIPYFEEMRNRRDELQSKFLINNMKPCKEEVFEARLKSVIQVYEEFKEKLENFIPKKTEINNISPDEID